MERNTTITLEKVVKGIYTYGWYPALHMLAKLEQKERFEDCAVIMKAFEGLLFGREGELSTKTDPSSLDETFNKLIRENHNQDVLINNMPKYIKDFEKLIKN